MDSDEIYRKKYLKYKKKYNDLKTEDQQGGVFKFFAKVSGNVAGEKDLEYQEKVKKQLKDYATAFRNSEDYKKLIEVETFKLSKADEKEVTNVLSGIDGFGYMVSSSRAQTLIDKLKKYKVNEVEGADGKKHKEAVLITPGSDNVNVDLKNIINEEIVDGDDKKGIVFKGDIIKIDGDLTQESYNTWASKIIVKEEERLIGEIEKTVGFDSVKDSDSESVKQYKEYAKPQKIVFLRGKEKAMKDCKKEGFSVTWLGCTKDKLAAFKLVKKEIPMITSEYSSLTNAIKNLKGDKAPLETAANEYKSKAISTLKEKLGEIEIKDDDLTIQTIQKLIENAPLNYTLPKVEETTTTTTEEKPEEKDEEPEDEPDTDDEQDGGFLPEFLTETPRV